MSSAAMRKASAAVKPSDPTIRELAPIRINLLPHRELKRERKKKDFVVLSALIAVAAIVTTYAGGVAINQQISNQSDRNGFIKTEITKLESQIGDIATLRDEIAALTVQIQDSLQRLFNEAEARINKR
jgi:type IV pilus assembly protein PilN